MLSWGYLLAGVLLSSVQADAPSGQVSALGLGDHRLAELIDRHVATAAAQRRIPLGSRCDDAEFLRRVTLDLAGRIPTVEEVRAFFGNTSPHKRAQAIDRLLASPDYPRRMQQVFDVMLLERRSSKHIKADQWRAYLRKSFAENKPLNQLFQEILEADHQDQSVQAAAKFYLARKVDAHLVTRDIGRLLLGRNLTCAQCHDHPVVGDFLQSDYWGIYAFVHRSYLFQDKKTKKTWVAEKADGQVTFASVFDPDTKEETGPRLPFRGELMEATPGGQSDYKIKPTKSAGGIPIYSRREFLAKELPSPQTQQFARNMANRLWAMMLGRGLVHPLDMHHSDNPPSHPELLEDLADALTTSGYDTRGFLRQVALSEAYQRSSQLPEGTTAEDIKTIPEDSFAVALQKPLSAEQLAAALIEATGLADLERRRLGEKLTPEALRAKLAVHAQKVLAVFVGPAGAPEGDFQSSLDQVLFLNNGTLLSWLPPGPGNLLDRLQKIEGSQTTQQQTTQRQTTQRIAEELFLAVLSRPPQPEEVDLVGEYLAKQDSAGRVTALQDILWALLTSAEFRLNH